MTAQSNDAKRSAWHVPRHRIRAEHVIAFTLTSLVGFAAGALWAT